MSAPPRLELSLHRRIAEIPAAEWDALAGNDGPRPRDPFITHRFLKALEDSGSVGPGTGWDPLHLALRDPDGTLVAAMPLYVKAHSQGEYVFDHSWAHAYERAGGRYYPKLQVAVPFTPVTGPRLLVRPDDADRGRATLVRALVGLAEKNGLSSAHVTFCTEDEAQAGQTLGLMHRTGQQFHWHNRGYGSFDDFLAALSSRKRKAIRRERRQAQGFGGTIHWLTGDAIRPEHWDAFWQFYQDTGARKWGRPYLTRAFFDRLHETMPDDVLLVMCRRDGRWIAGALNLIGADCLFGRYWGAIEHHPFLHFEVCYYQAIDHAIAAGLSRIEAGAQGEHKLARGYLPVVTHSLHWVRDPGFRRAVAEFLEQEREAVDEDIEILTSYGPFRRGGDEQDG